MPPRKNTTDSGFEGMTPGQERLLKGFQKATEAANEEIKRAAEDVVKDLPNVSKAESEGFMAWWAKLMRMYVATTTATMKEIGKILKIEEAIDEVLEQTQQVFGGLVDSIKRNIQTVIRGIKSGIEWTAIKISDAFQAFKSCWNNMFGSYMNTEY